MTQAIFRFDGRSIDYTPGSAVDAGTPVSQQGYVGVPINDISANALGALQVEGVFDFVKVTGAVAVGDILGWDNDGDPVGGTAGTGAATTVLDDADFLIGTCVASAVSAGAVVRTQLNKYPGSALINEDSSLIWVSTVSSGMENGTFNNPYTTITDAMAAVTSSRKTIMALPGTYIEAAPIVWPTDVSDIKLIGFGNQMETVIRASTGDQVIDVTPGAQAETFEMTIQNIQIDHRIDGQDGLDLDNTGMGKKLNVYLGNVGFYSIETDKSIITNMGDTDNAIRIYWDGDNVSCEGEIYLDAGNDGNRFYADNILFEAAFVTAADAVAYDIRLRYCGVLHEGISGGNAAQTFTAIGCYSKTGDTYAALDTNDLAGSHSEQIVSV